MAVNEQIVIGRFYRRLIDEASKLWERISFWTKASDVEFDDGQTAQTKVGAFKGVTTSTNVTTTGYAADATTVKTLNDNLGQGRVQIVVNDDGTLGYKVDGADTVLPFKNMSDFFIMSVHHTGANTYATFSFFYNGNFADMFEGVNRDYAESYIFFNFIKYDRTTNSTNPRITALQDLNYTAMSHSNKDNTAIKINEGILLSGDTMSIANISGRSYWFRPK